VCCGGWDRVLTCWARTVGTDMARLRPSMRRWVRMCPKVLMVFAISYYRLRRGTHGTVGDMNAALRLSRIFSLGCCPKRARRILSPFLAVCRRRQGRLHCHPDTTVDSHRLRTSSCGKRGLSRPSYDHVMYRLV